MRSRGLRVPRSEGERVRSRLREEHALRNDLKIAVEGEWILLPVEPAIELPGDLGELIMWDFEIAAAPGPQDYRDLLVDWPSEEREELPRSFDIIGDVVLLRIPPTLSHRSQEIGAALLRFVPGARIVGADHGVHGAERRRRVERLAGEGDWRTRHRENGLEFEVDLERAYFSPRLAREHARVAGEVRPGERVYDLCCGVGPFAVTIARTGRAASVVAVDLNPAAIALLRTTLARYPFGPSVEPIEASVERFLEGAKPVDVVVLNLPHEGIKYLPSVATVVRPGGRVFYYEVTDREGAEGHERDLQERLGGSPEWRLKDRHVAHPYSPTADLVAFTFERSSA
ncbi:MAG: methyltransferase domain-containing protein [Thermoplasmata archaeon]